MDKDIFLKVFNNKYLFNRIFSDVKYVNKKLNRSRTYKFSQIVNNKELLVKFNFYDELIKLKIDNEKKNGKDLLYHATLNGRYEIIKYLLDYKSKNIAWDYITAYKVTPWTKSFEIYQYIFSKVEKQISKDDLIETIHNAAYCGRLDIIQHIINTFCKSIKPMDYAHQMLICAIKRGHMNVIEYFHDNLSKYTPIKTPLLQYCAEYDQFEIMKYLHKHRIGQSSNETMDIAASNGNLKMIRWLHKNRNEGCTTDAMDYAASDGHLAIVKWLHLNRREGSTTSAMDEAAGNGHIEILKWLHFNRTEGCTTDAIDRAAEYGHLEIVKWLFENRTEGCSTKAIDLAAEKGYIEILKIIHQYSTEGCSSEAFCYSSENGQLSVVKWLHKNYIEECSNECIDYAAENGHLDIIQWLHENGTEDCTTDAMDLAASHGHLETIEWLHHNRTEGCTIDAICFAVDNNQFETVKWLYSNRSECKDLEYVKKFAKENVKKDIIKWIDQILIKNKKSTKINNNVSNGDPESPSTNHSPPESIPMIATSIVDENGIGSPNESADNYANVVLTFFPGEANYFKQSAEEYQPSEINKKANGVNRRDIIIVLSAILILGLSYVVL